MQLLNFKVDSSLLVVKLLILAAAVPFLWLTDLVAFLCDLKKIKRGKKLLTKGVGFAFILIASMHICENMLSELSELYVELLRVAWLGSQLLKFTSLSVLGSSLTICSVFIMIGLTYNLTNNCMLSLSPKQTEHNDYPSCSSTVLPDGSFFNSLNQAIQFNFNRIGLYNPFYLPENSEPFALQSF